ncbi:MAG TPA: futalosine hydrolase [Bacillota bacterium]|nr:futalosine hydrolase [Bacillota bacterium]
MGMRVLILTAVAAERDAVLRGLQQDSRFDVLLAGVGPVMAAAVTAKVLSTAEDDYDLVITAGIGGGFVGQAEVGSLVVASEIIAADLGVQTSEGFLSLDEMGFGSTRVEVDCGFVSRIHEAMQLADLPVQIGPVLTVSTVTGTAENALELTQRVPGAAAEAMEGYGVAVAAKNHGIPVMELRAISNAVGPRDRDAWRIKDALDALEAASSVLLEVLK